MSDNKWETQPRDEFGRFAKRGVAAARQSAVKGSSTFAPLNTLDDVLENPWVRQGAKFAIGTAAVAAATTYGPPVAAGLGIRTGTSALTHFTPASKIFFSTPRVKSAVFQHGSNSIQFAGRAAGYRRAGDNAIRGAVRGTAQGTYKENPFFKSIQWGKFPY